MRLKGFRILARQYRVPVGEIDIVARRGRVLALVEVKARDDWSSAADAVRARQQRRIQRAAQHLLVRRPDLAGLAIRFDVILVVPRSWPRHIPAAWIAER